MSTVTASLLKLGITAESKHSLQVQRRSLSFAHAPMKNFYFRSIKHSLSFFPCCSTNQRPFCLNLLIIRTEKIGTKNFFERNVAWVTQIRAEMCLLWSFIYFQVNLETREIWKSLCCLLNITVSLNVSFQHQLFVVTCDVECKLKCSGVHLKYPTITLENYKRDFFNLIFWSWNILL